MTRQTLSQRNAYTSPLMRATSKRRTSRLDKRSVIYNSSPSRRNSKRLQLVSAYTKQRKLDPNIASDSGYREDDSAEFATKARRGRSGRFSESIGVIWGTRREGVRWMCSGWRIGVVGGSKGASVEGAF